MLHSVKKISLFFRQSGAPTSLAYFVQRGCSGIKTLLSSLPRRVIVLPLSLFTFVLVFNLVPRVAHSSDSTLLLTPTVAENAKDDKNPRPPTQVQLETTSTSTPPPAPTSSLIPVSHVVLTIFVGALISAASLRMKFRRFIGLGVFTNVYAVLFLVMGALVCNLPRIPTNLMSSRVTASSLPWIADSVGLILTLLLGTQMGRSGSGGGGVHDLQSQISSNPIFAVFEDGIRDCLLTSMQSVALGYANQYNWVVISRVGERTLDEEVAIGRLKHEDSEAALKYISELRTGDQKSEFDRKYRAVIRLFSCCPLSRLRHAFDVGKVGEVEAAY
jgi:hypothetical protein